MQSKFYALQRQNQQLKMQLTELRNAFDLNRDVLNILSSKSEPTLRHFYLMLKKLNQHIIDLADNQFKARKERYKKTQQYHELELKYMSAQQQIEALKQTHQLLVRQGNEQQRKPEQRDNVVVTPKESHLIFIGEIRSISNELFVMGKTCATLKAENARLLAEIAHLRHGGQGHHGKGLMEPKRKYEERVEEIAYEESQEQQEGQYDGNRTVVIRGPATSRNKKSIINTGSPKQRPINNPTSQQPKKPKLLEIELENKIQQIEVLRSQKTQLINRLNLLAGVQKRIYQQSARKMPHQQRVTQQTALIDMVQWRVQMQCLDSPHTLRQLRWLRVRSRSL